MERTGIATRATLAALVTFVPAWADEALPIGAAVGPIEIDGHLDEPAWQDAQAFELRYETHPGDNTPAPAPTTCRILHDDRNLYVGCRAEDPDPAKIRARYSDRDSAFDDDFVGVVIDTFNDERRAFEFFVNPLGVQMDLVQDDVNGSEDASWNAIWNSSGRITDAGYEVEMAIPFSSLRFQRGSGPQTWGLDLVRIWPRGSRVRMGLNALERDVSCYLCQTTKIRGFEGAEPGRNLEINPTVTAGHSESIDPGAPTTGLTESDSEVDPGLDVRWGFTTNLTLNATLNPDFSQVEADVARVEVNQPFTLFFPERRPFFLEGADVFDTPMGAVYTRTVADPEWGAKVTGKEGPNALGIFVARDAETSLLFPGSQRSSLTRLDLETDVGVVRYRRDIGETSAVGALVTARDGGDYSNYVYGLDALYRPTEKDTFRAQVLGSQTEYSDQVAADFGQPTGRFEDAGYTFSYRHDRRNWLARATYEQVGEDFRADLGFVPRAGYDVTILGGEYRFWGDDDRWYDRVTVGGDWDETNDATGTLIERETEVFSWVQGPKQSFLFFGGGFRDRRFNDVELDEAFFNYEFSFRPTGTLFLAIDGGYSDRFDFAFAPSPGVARQGRETRVRPNLRFTHGRHLRLDLAHSYQELELPSGSPGVDGGGMPITVSGRVFRTHITESRLIYQFNVRMFLRLITQYRTLTFDDQPGFGAPPQDVDDLFNQFLFSYKVNPRTALYVGYADNRETAIDTADPTRWIQTDRTLFAKLGYAWVP